MRKAQRWWGVVAKVLTNMGEMVWEKALMYKVVVQTVLIYRSESWVVTDVMMKVLKGFHH